MEAFRLVYSGFGVLFLPGLLFFGRRAGIEGGKTLGDCARFFY